LGLSFFRNVFFMEFSQKVKKSPVVVKIEPASQKENR
jgi:hypothetical protein